MVVVVPGHERQDVVSAHAAAGGMNAGPLPLLRRHLPQRRQGLLAAPPERGQRLARFVAQVLTLLRPAVRSGRREPRIVHRGDRLEAELEEFFGVAQVAEHFHTCPVIAIRAPAQTAAHVTLYRGIVRTGWPIPAV